MCHKYKCEVEIGELAPIWPHHKDRRKADANTIVDTYQKD